MAFPVNPTDGLTYTANGVTYIYNASLGVWNLSGAVSTASPVSSVAGRTGAVTLTAADIGAGTFPGAITVPALTMTGTFTAASVTPATTFTVNGNHSVTGTLGATGATTLSSTLGVSGATTLSSTLNVTGGTTISSLSATSGTFSTTLGVTGATTLSSTLAVTGATTLSSTLQTTSLGIGTAPSGTAGQLLATNSITAFYSDGRLKTRVGKIENALDKIDQLSAFLYKHNEIAQSYGYTDDDTYVGLDANSVKVVQPEATALAPFDRDADGSSKSGENYLTVQYEKLVPLLVEGIKELRREINQLKGK